MDFMKLLRSFEEFLFEAVTWLVLYPTTVWRIVTRPLTTMAYSDMEQAADDEHRYDDALSPPLLLLITVTLMHLIEVALRVEAAAPETSLGQAVFASTQSLATFRGLAFGLIPLIAATTLLRRQKLALSRNNLRAPFYAQCYLATPCAIFISVGASCVHRPEISDLLGHAVMAVGAAWFLVTQTRWFAERLGLSLGRATITATWALVQAIVYLCLVLIPVVAL